MRYKVKDVLVCAAAVAVVAAVGLSLPLLLPGTAPHGGDPPAPAAAPAKTEPSSAHPAGAAVAAHTGPLHLEDENPVRDLVVLERLLRHYAMGNDDRMPAGTNAEITAALTRPDVYGIAALPADHPAIDADGKLNDRWGSPYFFHALSSTRMEIRSAGPDTEMYTADDLVWPDPASAGPAGDAAVSIR